MAPLDHDLIARLIEESERVAIEFATASHHRRAREWLDDLANQPITYADAVSFAVMEALRCTAALTFDSDFVVAGFSRWAPEGDARREGLSWSVR